MQAQSSDTIGEKNQMKAKSSSSLYSQCPIEFKVFKNYEIVTNTYWKKEESLSFGERRDCSEYPDGYCPDAGYRVSFTAIEATDDDLQDKSFYDPLRNLHGLVSGINRINVEKNRSILSFCNHYGLFGLNDPQKPHDVDNLEISLSAQRIYIRENLELFKIKVQEFQYATKLWGALGKELKSNQDNRVIAGYIEEFDSQWGVERIKSIAEPIENFSYFGLDLEDTFIPTRQLKAIQPKSPEVIAKAYLCHLINSSMQGVFHKVQLVNGNITQAIFVRSPLDAAWWKLAKDVCAGAEFRPCKKCGALFPVRHGKQEYCPAPPGKQRSTCGNTHNQATKRARKQTPSQIIATNDL